MVTVFKLLILDEENKEEPLTMGLYDFDSKEIRIYRIHPRCNGLGMVTTIIHEVGHFLLDTFGKWSLDTHHLYDCLYSDLCNLFMRKVTCYTVSFLEGRDVQAIVKRLPKEHSESFPSW